MLHLLPRLYLCSRLILSLLPQEKALYYILLVFYVCSYRVFWTVGTPVPTDLDNILYCIFNTKFALKKPDLRKQVGQKMQLIDFKAICFNL